MKDAEAGAATGIQLQDMDDKAALPKNAQVPADVIFGMARTPIYLDRSYKPPKVPSILQIENLKIGEISILLFLHLILDNLDFIPETYKKLLRIISIGNTFSLERTKLKFAGLGKSRSQR